MTNPNNLKKKLLALLLIASTVAPISAAIEKGENNTNLARGPLAVQEDLTVFGNNGLRLVRPGGDINNTTNITTDASGAVFINNTQVFDANGAPSLGNVDINGGTIDGTTIGGDNPADGSFTNINVTNGITATDIQLTPVDINQFNLNTFTCDNTNRARLRYNGTEDRIEYCNGVNFIALAAGKHVTNNGPASVNSPFTKRRIFISKDEYIPGVNFSGIQSSSNPNLPSATQICTNLANQAGMAGAFRAVMSDDNNLIRNDAQEILGISNDTNLVLVDLTTVVSAGKVWDGNIDNIINKDQNGNLVHFGGVWTGTNGDGTATSSTPAFGNGNCNNWTSSSSSHFGLTGLVSPSQGILNANWTAANATRCNTPQHIYCYDASVLAL